MTPREAPVADLPTLRARVAAAQAQRDRDLAMLRTVPVPLPPDPVTLAADLLAALEAAQTERDEARAELTAIRAALGNGADEAAWPPGLTLAEAVGRLRDEHHSLRDVLQWVNDQCPGKCSAVCDSALRAGHEGSHAEALGDNGGPNG